MSIENAVVTALKDCLGVKAKEKVLIICDKPLRRIGESFWEAATVMDVEPILMEITPRTRHGEEPPAAVSEAMKMVDVVIAPTTFSLTHTNARRKANLAGARVVTLPDISEEILERTLNADYFTIRQKTEEIYRLLKPAKKITVTSNAGTNFTTGVEGREWHLDTGIYHEPGEFGNLPGGECYIAPQKCSANGIVVLDGSIAGYGLVDSPVELTIKDGKVINIEGGDAANWLNNTLAPFGENGRNVAELGIGTNDKALVKGKLLEDEKAKGTVHVALGNNASFGGEVDIPVHIDGIILYPNLKVDGKLIISNGYHNY